MICNFFFRSSHSSQDVINYFGNHFSDYIKSKTLNQSDGNVISIEFNDINSQMMEILSFAQCINDPNVHRSITSLFEYYYQNGTPITEIDSILRILMSNARQSIAANFHNVKWNKKIINGDDGQGGFYSTLLYRQLNREINRYEVLCSFFDSNTKISRVYRFNVQKTVFDAIVENDAVFNHQTGVLTSRTKQDISSIISGSLFDRMLQTASTLSENFIDHSTLGSLFTDSANIEQLNLQIKQDRMYEDLNKWQLMPRNSITFENLLFTEDQTDSNKFLVLFVSGSEIKEFSMSKLEFFEINWDSGSPGVTAILNSATNSQSPQNKYIKSTTAFNQYVGILERRQRSVTSMYIIKDSHDAKLNNISSTINQFYNSYLENTAYVRKFNNLDFEYVLFWNKINSDQQGNKSETNEYVVLYAHRVSGVLKLFSTSINKTDFMAMNPDTTTISNLNGTEVVNASPTTENPLYFTLDRFINGVSTHLNGNRELQTNLNNMGISQATRLWHVREFPMLSYPFVLFTEDSNTNQYLVLFIQDINATPTLHQTKVSKSVFLSYNRLSVTANDLGGNTNISDPINTLYTTINAFKGGVEQWSNSINTLSSKLDSVSGTNEEKWFIGRFSGVAAETAPLQKNFLYTQDKENPNNYLAVFSQGSNLVEASVPKSILLESSFINHSFFTAYITTTNTTNQIYKSITSLSHGIEQHSSGSLFELSSIATSAAGLFNNNINFKTIKLQNLYNKNVIFHALNNNLENFRVWFISNENNQDIVREKSISGSVLFNNNITQTDMVNGSTITSSSHMLGTKARFDKFLESIQGVQEQSWFVGRFTELSAFDSSRNFLYTQDNDNADNYLVIYHNGDGNIREASISKTLFMTSVINHAGFFSPYTVTNNTTNVLYKTISSFDQGIAQWTNGSGRELTYIASQSDSISNKVNDLTMLEGDIHNLFENNTSFLHIELPNLYYKSVILEKMNGPDSYKIYFLNQENGSDVVRSKIIAGQDVFNKNITQQDLLNGSDILDNSRSLGSKERFITLVTTLKKPEENTIWFVRKFDGMTNKNVLFTEDKDNKANYLVVYIDEGDSLREASINKQMFLSFPKNLDTASLDSFITSNNSTNVLYKNIDAFQTGIEQWTVGINHVSQQLINNANNGENWFVGRFVAIPFADPSGYFLYTQDKDNSDNYLIVFSEGGTIKEASIPKNTFVNTSFSNYNSINASFLTTTNSTNSLYKTHVAFLKGIDHWSHTTVSQIVHVSGFLPSMSSAINQIYSSNTTFGTISVSSLYNKDIIFERLNTGSASNPKYKVWFIDNDNGSEVIKRTEIDGSILFNPNLTQSDLLAVSSIAASTEMIGTRARFDQFLNNLRPLSANSTWYVRQFPLLDYKYVMFKEDKTNTANYFIIYAKKDTNGIFQIFKQSMEKKEFLGLGKFINYSTFSGVEIVSVDENNTVYDNFNRFVSGVEQNMMGMTQNIDQIHKKWHIREFSAMNYPYVLYTQDDLNKDNLLILYVDNNQLYEMSYNRNEFLGLSKNSVLSGGSTNILNPSNLYYKTFEAFLGGVAENLSYTNLKDSTVVQTIINMCYKMLDVLIGAHSYNKQTFVPGVS